MSIKNDIGYVYFIYSEEELLYIGQTNYLIERLRQHDCLYEKKYPDNNIYFEFRSYKIYKIEYIEVKLERIREIEKNYIKCLNPKLNKTHKGKKGGSITDYSHKIESFDLFKNKSVKISYEELVDIEAIKIEHSERDKKFLGFYFRNAYFYDNNLYNSQSGKKYNLLDSFSSFLIDAEEWLCSNKNSDAYIMSFIKNNLLQVIEKFNDRVVVKVRDSEDILNKNLDINEYIW